MTVKELCEAGSSLNNVEIIVREDGFGQWIQGYRIGKSVELYRYEYRAENREKSIHYGFKEKALMRGEETDIINPVNRPMKVIKKDIKNMPEYIGNLKVSHYQPRHLYTIHGEALTHNDFDLDIWCYPEGYIEEKPDFSNDIDKNGQLVGQISFDV